MQLEVRRDDDMPWTEEHVLEIRECPEVLGVTREACDEQLEIVRAAPSPIPVIHPEHRGQRENYTLLVDGHVAGAVTTTRRGRRWEVDVFVYRRFRGHDFARRALAEVLRSNPTRHWEARVRKDNKAMRRLREINAELGFDVGPDDPDLMIFTRPPVSERGL